MRKVYTSTINCDKKGINVFAEKYRAFKRYHPRKRFIFQQLILNFVDFRRNNSLFMHTKIKHLKNINSKESVAFLIVSHEKL